ncbi:MAG: hypothetical protein GWN00_32295, partial [Aliifodinibius sp.]|nr:hypothetical protein [Phycisphaerae bacterium]NIS50376.1 hypothetical protein [Phycisphaerae bacterium]NIT60718.1 hypothetical protein [Fodinibius sp.]NIW97603.1 hypothetical protein [Phycisphaerae bacterium]NIY29300.1 hypothetical protein [Fodinibius sp.]
MRWQAAREIKATYGGSRTPCDLYVCECDGVSWYAVEGSQNINATYEYLEHGVDIETLEDHDTAQADSPIESLEQLIAEVEEL